MFLMLLNVFEFVSSVLCELKEGYALAWTKYI